MTNSAASLVYRRAVTQQSSVVGLVVALHDTLMGDLRRAADAIDNNDIQTRCDQLIHGFKVLQQLDAMLNMEHGGETAVNVRRFYKHLRGQMLSAQFKLSSEILRKQVTLILEVRQAWQQIDGPPMAERKDCSTAPSSSMHPAAERALAVDTRTPFSCVG